MVSGRVDLIFSLQDAQNILLKRRIVLSVYRRDFLFFISIAGAGLALPNYSLRAKPTYPISNYLNDLTKLPTARECLICHKTIEEVGGQMLIYTHFRGTILRAGSKIRDFPNLRVLLRLFDDRDLYFAAWGEESIFTETVINQALREYLNGEQPWHCQICGMRECHLCGKPLVALAYGDYACREHGHGCYSKGANLGANRGCIDPKCQSSEYFNNVRRSLS